MAKEVLGVALSAEDQRYVLSAYVYRSVKTNTLSKKLGVRPLYENDLDWLSHTFFRVRKNGRLDLRVKQCRSIMPKRRK